MPRSAGSLMRSGAISEKAYNKTLAKTKVQASGGKAFTAPTKDEGTTAPKAAAGTKVGHINRPGSNKASVAQVGAPTNKKAIRGGQPKVGHINQAQGPKFPKGGKAC